MLGSATDTNLDTLQSVSRTDGAYGVSRKVNPLQRIFDNYRNYSSIGNRFSYDGCVYEVIEDNGGAVILAERIVRECHNKRCIVASEDRVVKKFSFIDVGKHVYWYSDKKTPLSELKSIE